MSVTVLHGDCLDILPTLSGLDAVVCDPPYLLTSIVDRFGKADAAPAQFGKDGRFKRLSGGFMGCSWDAPEMPPIDPGFAHWMAGFIDGEGCFSVHKKMVNGCQTFDCQFSITLRADDAGIIKEMHKQLGGIGSIAERQPSQENAGKQIRYCISSKADCQKLRAVLRVFPLRAKKARDFEVWSLALDEWLEHEPGGSWEGMAYFRDYLMAVRRYGSHFSPDQLFHYRWASRVYDALKPGAHLIAFGGSRTFHRMAVAIEDAGFEIRDSLCWITGSGFPKSHDVSKGIDKAAGAEREIVGEHHRHGGGSMVSGSMSGPLGTENILPLTAPATPEAARWQGWGTALKPAVEFVVLARKPLSEKTVAANVLRHGTGAINIDACRVEGVKDVPASPRRAKQNQTYGDLSNDSGTGSGWDPNVGRWPANVLHDGSAEVEAAFQAFGERRPEFTSTINVKQSHGLYGKKDVPFIGVRHGDGGSASRFFYSAKADADDRAWSKHPTVKPIALMRWLVRLITPPGGTVLDCFAGSGTTGEAARLEGFNAVLIEREAEYVADIHRRLGRASGEDTPLFSGAA